MPGTKDRRKIGARHYANYSLENLNEAIKLLKAGKISQRSASELYGIPRRTLNYKLKGFHTGSVGFPTVFSTEEEEALADHVKAVSHFGFPVDTYDLRCIAKSYLDRSGQTIKVFENNFPGKDWVKSFLSRHNDLSQRLSTNIKIARAAVTKEIIKSYFQNLAEELDGVPDTHVWNYDETCVVDDPGLKKVITKKGVKYPERLCNSSKASTSIMFCGNAAGELAPPYVNYKAEKLWDLWTIGGPPHTRYNRSKSGWFDSESFQDWFETTMLPIMKKLEGKKVLLGDNLSSHINMKVLQLCRDNNITFICLPPNSTHLTQPLDISMFRPLKIAWRKVLDLWKSTPTGRRCCTVPKNEFPHLLKQLMQEIEKTAADNLKSGFRKAGIYPFQPDNVLARIPNAQTFEVPVSSNMESSFIDYLENKRKEATTPSGKGQGRKRKLPIEAGKSVSFEELQHLQENNQKKTLDKGLKNRKKHTNENLQKRSSDNASDVVSNVSSDEETRPSCAKKSVARRQQLKIRKDVYVIVNYFNEYYPGVVTESEEKRVLVSVMHKSTKSWIWPSLKDELWYDIENVIQIISEPKQSLKRGYFSVPEISKYWK